MDATVVYVDRYVSSVLYSWMMTTLALWVAGRTLGHAVRLRRCAVCGTVGAVYLIWVYLARFGFLPGQRLAMHPLTWAAAGLAMIGLTFRLRGFRTFMAATWRFLLVTVIPVGLAEGVRWFAALYHIPLPQWVHGWLPPALLLVMGELGWGVVHQAIQASAMVPVELVFGEAVVKVNALVDTGNLLTDPLTRAPVVIVELAELEPVLPVQVRQAVTEFCAGGCPDVVSAEEPWFARLRLLPYLTIGREHGMLPGLRADEIKLRWDGREVRNARVIVGLYDKPLCRDGSYHALIPPAFLHTV